MTPQRVRRPGSGMDRKCWCRSLWSFQGTPSWGGPGVCISVPFNGRATWCCEELDIARKETLLRELGSMFRDIVWNKSFKSLKEVALFRVKKKECIPSRNSNIDSLRSWGMSSCNPQSVNLNFNLPLSSLYFTWNSYSCSLCFSIFFYSVFFTIFTSPDICTFSLTSFKWNQRKSFDSNNIHFETLVSSHASKAIIPSIWRTHLLLKRQDTN